MNSKIKAKLALLPSSPGCYLHKNSQGQIIYVGKAKNLKNRVRSYFRGSHDTKTEMLVSEIDDFEFIVTSSAIEALLLEINLIQENKPKFNIMLRDDKSYPFIKITDERHPRLIITRQVKKGTGTYFGPYPDVGAANQTKKLLDRLYPFRKCKLPEDKFCLYYHLGQCLAHGDNLPSREDYAEIAKEVGQFLTGHDDKIIKNLQYKMQVAAERWEFERAGEYRDLLESISTLRTKQRVMAQDMRDRDVFGYAADKGWLSVQVFFVRQGKLIERKSQLFPYYGEAEEDFLTFLGQFYRDSQHLVPKEVLLPKAVDEQAAAALVSAKIVQPQRGEKKQLVQLASKNAKVSLQQKFDLLEKDIRQTHGAVEHLGERLGLGKLTRIEAFDNSNMMGTSPVSAMAVFVDGKASKRDYRKYKIKTVEGPDDYASMREVIYRRYSRVKKDGLPEPDLIIIDGGQGQVNAARDSLEALGMTHIPVAGLQKNERHQTHELLFGSPLQTVDLARNSQEFFLLQRIQDEVHRFAISFHRQVRSKNTFSSQLDSIEGLGPKRKQKLLRHFKSVSKLSQASSTEIAEVGLPYQVAERIQQKLAGWAEERQVKQSAHTQEKSKS